MRAVLLIAVVLALAGCGGTNTPAPTTAPASASEPIGPQLSALCRDANKGSEEFAKRGNELLDAGKYDEAGQLMRDDLKGAYAFDAKVSQLDPPPEERVAFRAYVGANKRLRRLDERTVEAWTARDFKMADALSDQWDVVAAARLDAALELGADDCGS